MQSQCRKLLALCLAGCEELVCEDVIRSIGGRTEAQREPYPTAYTTTKGGVCSGAAGVGKLMVTTDGSVEQILAVRSVQSWFAHLVTFVGLDTSSDGLDQIEALLKAADWTNALQTWKDFHRHYRPDRVAELEAEAGNLAGVRFRGSAIRDGKHDFQSPDVAAAVGAAVGELFPFQVELSNFDMEVVAIVLYDHLHVGINLNPGTHCRHGLPKEIRAPLVEASRKATLRPSTAYVMCKLLDPQPGEVLIDPCCGVGTVMLEASFSWDCVAFGGDADAEAQGPMARNLQELGACSSHCGKATGLVWDAQRLPVRDGIVDLVVSDLPFGFNCGTTRITPQLYASVLDEMARVCVVGARVALLVQNKKVLEKLLQNDYWKDYRYFTVNIGGFVCWILLAVRSEAPHTPLVHRKQKRQSNQPRSSKAKTPRVDASIDDASEKEQG